MEVCLSRPEFFLEGLIVSVKWKTTALKRQHATGFEFFLWPLI
jgi:hypothetical protein